MNDMSFTRIDRNSKKYDKNMVVEDIKEDSAKNKR